MLLIVDDDPLFLAAAEAALARDLPVFFARDARQSADLMRTIGEGLSCLMIDLDLPGVNGFELIAEMRRAFPDLPIIAVSGVYQANALESAKAMGAAEVLSKPVTPEWRGVVDRVRRRALNQ